MPKLLAERAYRRARGGIEIELDLAADQRRRQAAERDRGVGDGRLGAALAVADRAGIGAGALRADLELAVGVGPGDRAAAGADGDDVEHRRLHRIALDHRGRGVHRLVVLDDRHVGRGAADVDGEDVPVAGELGHVDRAEDAGGRPGEQHGHRPLGGGRVLHDAAVRLHDQEGDLAGARSDLVGSAFAGRSCSRA